MFDRVYLEITNLCNFECSFCPIKDRDVSTLPLNDFSRIASELKPITKEVCLHLMGEPLAYKDFPELLRIAEEIDLTIQLTTNGLLIKKYQEELLNFKGLRQINFSLQSFRDNFPQKKLDEYLGPIFDFTEAAFEKRPELYLNYRLWNLGAEKDNEDFFQQIEKRFSLEIKRSVDVTNIKSKKLLNRLYLHFDSRFDWPSLSLPNQGVKGRCHGMIGHFGIHADGTVVPCCLDQRGEIVLGNVFENSIHDILNSERAKNIREGFLLGERRERLCQHCTFINRFQ